MKSPAPASPPPEAIDFDSTELLIARDKRYEPFVKTFAYKGDHINVEHLGTFIGFFEIPTIHEDSAYIVNFLASVANKEYFAQPRRGAVESFEAALHKINLALTELVKEGNTEWLGNLNGIVAVIEGNNFHFSATGDGSILLFRNDEATLISEGLADKDAAIHPLKTFLEISSGKLLEDDKILITSPELFSLCTREMMEKNASRMDPQAFIRYIRAALVNELNLGTSVIIDIRRKDQAKAKKEERKRAEAQREARAKQKLENVFSQNTFASEAAILASGESVLEGEPLSPEAVDLLREKYYTDSKTGHIYIRGEDEDLDYSQPKLSWFDSPSWYSLKKKFSTVSKRQNVKAKKWLVSAFLWSRAQAAMGLAWLGTEGKALIANAILSLRKRPSGEPVLRPALRSESPRLLSSWTESLAQRTQKFFNTEENVIFSLEFFPSFFPKRALLIVLGLFFVGVGVVWFFHTRPTAPVEQTQAPTAVQPAPAPLTETERKSFGAPLLSETVFSGTPYAVTTSAIVNEATGENTPYPNGATVRLSSFMDDLGLFFLITDQNTVLSYSPVDKSFKENTLPEGFILTKSTIALDTYLTYLYLYDSTTGQIQRFPRVENGFGDPVSWLHTTLTGAKTLVVHENVFLLTQEGALQEWSQGTKTRDLATDAGLASLVFSQDKSQVATLNPDSGHLLIFSAEGDSVADISADELKGKRLINYDSSSRIATLSDQETLVRYQLKQQ